MVTKNSMKGFVWILLAFMLILSSFTVIADDSLAILGDIPNIFVWDNGANFYTPDGDSPGFDNFSIYNTRTGSDERFPILATFDDGEKLFLATDGTSLMGFSLTGDSFVKDIEYEMPFSMISQPLALIETSTGLKVITHNNTHFLTLNKTDSGFEILNATELEDSLYSGSPIICNSEDFATPMCFGILIDASAQSLGVYFPETGTTAIYGDDVDTAYGGVSDNIAIASLKNNGDQQIIFGTVASATSGSSNINIYDFNSNSSTSTATPKSCTDTTRSKAITQISVYNLDGGYSEVLASFTNTHRSTDSETQGTTAGVMALKQDGTAFGTQYYTAQSCGSSAPQSSIVYNHFVGSIENQVDVCMSYTTISSGVSYNHFKCYDATTGSSFLDDTTESMGYFAGYDYDLDGYYDLYNSKGFIDTTGVGSLYEMDFNDATSGLATLGDLDSDGIPELLKLTSTIIVMETVTSTNDPPVLNNSIGKGGYTGYYETTTCLNTSVNFKAVECLYSDDCNYNNDVATDTERIVTDCGKTTKENGTYSNTNPVFSCVYNETGTYTVRLYLQDSANDEDFSQYNTEDIRVNVIDGIDGLTCNTNIISSTDDIPVVADVAVEGDFDSLWDSLFNGSEILKFLLAMILIIGAIFATTQVTQNSFVVALVGVLVMGGCTVFGILSAWIMIIFLISMVLLLVMKATLFTNSE